MRRWSFEIVPEISHPPCIQYSLKLNMIDPKISWYWRLHLYLYIHGHLFQTAASVGNKGEVLTDDSNGTELEAGGRRSFRHPPPLAIGFPHSRNGISQLVSLHTHHCALSALLRRGFEVHLIYKLWAAILHLIGVRPLNIGSAFLKKEICTYHNQVLQYVGSLHFNNLGPHSFYKNIHCLINIEYSLSQLYCVLSQLKSANS